jgi:hypothetical protein
MKLCVQFYGFLVACANHDFPAALKSCRTIWTLLSLPTAPEQQKTSADDASAAAMTLEHLQIFLCVMMGFMPHEVGAQVC